jgi:hypothetical protein
VHRIGRLGRRGPARDGQRLEHERQLPPADPGCRVELRLAEAFVRRPPHAEGRLHRGENRAPAGEGQSEGPEKRYRSGQHARATDLHARRLGLLAHLPSREGREHRGEMHLLGLPAHLTSKQRGTRASRRDASSWLARASSNRAIAVVVGPVIFRAYGDPRTSRMRIPPNRARLSRARSRISPPGMRIFQAGRCTP